MQARSLRCDLDEGRTGSTLPFPQVDALRLEPSLPPRERGWAEAGLLCKSPTGKTAGPPGLNLSDPLFSRHPRSSHAAENDRDLSTSSERGPSNGYRRYEDKSIVITTNLAFSDWSDIFPNASCVTALIDRLTHHADICLIEGESYRHREAEEARKARRPAGKKK